MKASCLTLNTDFVNNVLKIQHRMYGRIRIQSFRILTRNGKVRSFSPINFLASLTLLLIKLFYHNLLRIFPKLKNLCTACEKKELIPECYSFIFISPLFRLAEEGEMHPLAGAAPHTLSHLKRQRLVIKTNQGFVSLSIH